MDDTPLNLVVREIMNGTWFFLSVFMAGIFAWRVVQHVTRHFADQPEPYIGPLRTIARLYGTVRCQRDVQAAIALTVFFAGSVVRSAWAWSLLWCENNGVGCHWLQGSYHPGLVATALAVVGTLCLMRVFTPRRWQPWAWIGGGLAAVALPLIMHFIL